MPQKKDIGKIRIKGEVISAIIASAVKDLEDVMELGTSFTDGIKQVLSKKSTYKGIKVEIKDNSVKIYVSIIIKQGCFIYEVSKNLQHKIKDEVEKTSGLKVKSVDIIVQNLSYKEEK